MKHSLSFIFLLLGLMSLRAQDTIYKRNGEIVPAKITEISTAEVKYKRFSMPDGPMFVIGRNEVQKIRFSNGVIDSFSVTPPVAAQHPATTESPVTVQHQALVLSGMIESPRRGLYYYNKAKISEKRMLLIASDKNRNWKNKELEQAIVATRDYKSNQYIAGFGGPVVLLGCMIAAGQTAQNNSNPNVTIALIFNGVGIFITSQIMSPIFKGKRSQSAARVVRLFNEQVQQHQQQQ